MSSSTQTKVDADEVPIYCVNLASSVYRRQRMEDRFKYHGLQKRVSFIDAVTINDPLLSFYHEGYPIDTNNRMLMCSSACFISHLKAVREFVDDPRKLPFGIICEDDILLDNDFSIRLEDVLCNTPPHFNLVSLSYMIVGGIHTQSVGLTSDGHHTIKKMDPVNTWGAQMYVISRVYAEQVLILYENVRFVDQPTDLHSSEIIIRASGGYIAYPPLAIEDGIDSDRAPEDLPYHHNHFRQWGYENYNECEKVDLCPFAN